MIFGANKYPLVLTLLAGLSCLQTLVTPARIGVHSSPTGSNNNRAAAGGEISLNKDRVQLLKDALSWVTFRREGVLPTQDDVHMKQFIDTLMTKYRQSKYYRSFVIAFQHGVLPKLTLNEGQACQPMYRDLYRDPFNNSVTDHYIKKFTFTSYYALVNGSTNGGSSIPAAFCDYRQGLICNRTTSTCECPSGSTMSPVSSGGTDKRCLLGDGQVCALVDLEHWGTHEIMRGQLPIMIFNLEKTPGCQVQHQCRLGGDHDDAFEVPRCHKGSTTAFDNGDTHLELGRKCVLNLYTDNGGGTCDFYSAEKLTCWDYGPRSYPNSPQKWGVFGYCAKEHGEHFGNGVGGRVMNNPTTGEVIDYQPFVIPFVNPRTTAWPSENDYSTFKEYLGNDHTSGLQELVYKYFTNVQANVGGPCSVEKTAEMQKIWTFYAKLDKHQPSGGGLFGANDEELSRKLDEARSLVEGPYKICRVNKNIQRNGGLTDNIGPALKCVSSGKSADSDGNNGKCEHVPNDETDSAAHRLKQYLDHDLSIKTALANEEKNVDHNILAKYPESGCNPDIAPTTSLFRHAHADVLEGMQCPPGTYCVEDYSDIHGMYTSNCQLKPDVKPLTVCQDASDINGPPTLEPCEQKHMEEKVKKMIQEAAQHAKLERGKPCQHHIESGLLEAIHNTGAHNPYKIVYLITTGIKAGGFCDPTKLLECSPQNLCNCVENTTPRSIPRPGDTDLQYNSDYCYVTSGHCRVDVTLLVKTFSSSQVEQLKKHYAAKYEISEDCRNGNVCAYANSDAGTCSPRNTGSTGLDGNSEEKDPDEEEEGEEEEEIEVGVTEGKKSEHRPMHKRPRPPPPEEDAGAQSIVLPCPILLRVGLIISFFAVLFT